MLTPSALPSLALRFTTCLPLIASRLAMLFCRTSCAICRWLADFYLTMLPCEWVLGPSSPPLARSAMHLPSWIRPFGGRAWLLSAFRFVFILSSCSFLCSPCTSHLVAGFITWLPLMPSSGRLYCSVLCASSLQVILVSLLELPLARYPSPTRAAGFGRSRPLVSYVCGWFCPLGP